MVTVRQAAEDVLVAWDTRAGIDEASKKFEALRAALEVENPAAEFVGLDLDEMDSIINGNITITDPRLRDGVYGVVLDTINTLMEKNT